MGFILAADTGGTFTDVAACDTASGRIVYAKHLTTYDDLVRGVMECVRKAKIDLAEVELIKFGTTLVINTFVQRTGAKAALVTTEGFRDVLEIRRGNRTMPFELTYAPDPVLIERDHRFEVRERIGPDGSVLEPLEEQTVDRLVGEFRRLGVEAIAVSLHNAYANSTHEERVAALLRARCPELYVTAGTELSREWYEYERSSTAAANAYVGPALCDYVGRLDRALRSGGFGRTFYLMASNGGVFSVERAERQPIMLVESGPVGGSIGAGVVATELGFAKAIAFDMGGTTAKCAVLEDGRFEVKSPYYVGGTERGFPVRGSVLDIVEVGTGGGSIAWLDDQRRLAVGPKSAGSSPGPACYGRGGAEPTITDANLVLGRIGAASFLGGEMTLDTAAAGRAIGDLASRMGLGRALEPMASGILDIAMLSMAAAIKRITIERGLDPREFALVAFGGGGPLHGASLARELAIPELIVPPEPGVFSALGMLLADARVDESRTFLRPLEKATVAEMSQAFESMEAGVRAALGRELADPAIVFERQAEMRFHGQRHTVRTAIGALANETAAETEEVRSRFEKNYERRYGFVERGSPVEIVGLVLTAVAAMPRPRLEHLAPVSAGSAEPTLRPVCFGGKWIDTPVYQRASLPVGFAARGPAVIEEYGSTTVAGPGDRFEIGRLGEIRIRFD